MHPDKFRWIVVVAGVLIQICLGTMYTWSVFKGPLIEHFKWDPVAVSLTFSIMVVTFHTSTVVWGKIQDRFGPRWIALLGGLVYALGLFLASRTTSLFSLYVTYGFVGGTGVAAGYVCVLSACLKWFPDKRGLVSGLSIAGFGMGSTVFSGIAALFIARYGILDAFTLLGCIYGVVVLVCSQVLRNPPEGYVPAGWAPGEQHKKTTGSDFIWQDMVRTPQFWLIVLSFFFGANVGMMTVSNLVGIATSHGVSHATAILAISLFFVCNVAGRIGFGMASDKYGRLTVLKIVFGCEVISLVSYSFISGTAVLVPLCLTGLSWGGIVSIYPSLTADYFGVKNVGTNYGFVFMMLGICLIASPIIYDYLKGPSGFMDPLNFSALLALAGLGFMFVLRPPRHPGAAEEAAVFCATEQA